MISPETLMLILLTILSVLFFVFDVLLVIIIVNEQGRQKSTQNAATHYMNSLHIRISAIEKKLGSSILSFFN